MSGIGTSLIRELLRNAMQCPTATAWVDAQPNGPVRLYSWDRIAREIIRLSDAMCCAGIRPGESIGLVGQNSRELVLCLLALRLVGASQSNSDGSNSDRSPLDQRNPVSCGSVDVVLDHRLDDQQIERLLTRVRARAVLLGRGQTERAFENGSSCTRLQMSQLRAAADMLPSPVDVIQRAYRATEDMQDDEPSSILFTSGTHSTPKGVVLTHKNLHSNAAAKLTAVPQDAADVRLCVLPLSHAYARTCDLGTWILSRSMLACGGQADKMFDLARSVRPTAINMVPHLAQKIVAQLTGNDHPETVLDRLGLDRLRLLGVGGAALPRRSFDLLTNAGIVVIQGYGLTEASPVICSATPQDATVGIVGRPVAGVDLQIDPAGQVVCRGDGVMHSYYDDPQATANRVRDGWLQTGDLGRLDEQGRLQILGRRDDVIVLSTGWKVMPAEIETRVAGLEGIEFAILTGNNQPRTTVWIRGADEVDDSQLLSLVEHALKDLHEAAIPRSLRRIPFALSVADGTLTAKGTPRRKEILRRIERLCGALA